MVYNLVGYAESSVSKETLAQGGLNIPSGVLAMYSIAMANVSGRAGLTEFED